MSNNIVELIIKKLIEIESQITTCESMTGGLLASQITSIENSSKVFKMGFITYSNDSKIKIINVDKKTLNEFGAISQETARAMAIGAMKKMQTDISVSITGNASIINPIENKQTGLSFICIIVFNTVYEFKFIAKSNNRNDIRIETTSFVLNELWKAIKDLRK